MKWKIFQKLQILQYFDDPIRGNGNITKTCKFAKTDFGLATDLSRNTLKTWIRNKDEIMNAPNADRTVMLPNAVNEGEGEHPEMEVQLAQLIRKSRKSGCLIVMKSHFAYALHIRPMLMIQANI